MSILAIDQSTSATKAMLFDRTGGVIDRASLGHRQIYPRPGWVEHDAEEIWANTLAAIGRLDLSGVEFLSITNQRETIVVFDRATGRPLHNALVWQDRRGEPICHELVDGGNEEMVVRKTGLKIDTYFSASKLTWLIRNRPDIAAELRDGSALVGTIDAYLIYRLSCGSVFATDSTNASRTLLYNIAERHWDEQLCELFRVPRAALPVVQDATARFGAARFEAAGKQVTVPICGVMGDSQASLFAHQCFSPGMAKVTLGTGSSVLLNIGRELRLAGDAAVSTIAWSDGGVATYSFEGIINYAAATIAWLKDQLGLITDPAETEAAAMSVPDNGGVYLVPAFGGLSAPHWSPGARAAIVGLSAHSNRNHVIRAALESIAYQLRDVLDVMRRRGGVELKTINADGGATRNKFLMQFIADMIRLDVTAADMPDCSALGAAMAGMIGTGATFEQLQKLPRAVTTYSPRMRLEEADGLYDGWKKAVGGVVAWASSP